MTLEQQLLDRLDEFKAHMPKPLRDLVTDPAAAGEMSLTMRDFATWSMCWLVVLEGEVRRLARELDKQSS